MVDEYGSATDAALPDAAAWIADLMTGTVASVIATLALGLVGFAMLEGRIYLRTGLRVVLGCFVLFNAAQIARGIVDFANDRAETSASSTIVAPPALPSAAPQFDPYAGAATPR